MRSAKWVMMLILAILVLASCAGAPAPSAASTATPTAASMTAAGNSAGHGMDAVPDQGVPNATAARGAQPLTPRIENGVKVFELTATPVKWTILKDVVATAWTYNGTVPGPMVA